MLSRVQPKVEAAHLSFDLTLDDVIAAGFDRVDARLFKRGPAIAHVLVAVFNARHVDGYPDDWKVTHLQEEGRSKRSSQLPADIGAVRRSAHPMRCDQSQMHSPATRHHQRRTTSRRTWSSRSMIRSINGSLLAYSSGSAARQHSSTTSTNFCRSRSATSSSTVASVPSSLFSTGCRKAIVCHRLSISSLSR